MVMWTRMIFNRLCLRFSAAKESLITISLGKRFTATYRSCYHSLRV